MTEELVSFNPKTFSEGGGLINDVEGEFSDFKFMLINPSSQGVMPGDVPYLISDFVTGEGTYSMRWSCGGAAYWEPSPDGKSLKPKGTAKTLNKGSNVAIFFTSLYNAGYPEDKLDLLKEDIGLLNGMVAHIIRVPEPERKGFSRPAREDGRTGGGIVTIHKIIKFPWDKAAAKGKGKAAPKAPATSDALEKEVVGIVLSALADSPEGVAKKDIIRAVVADAAQENRGAGMQLVNNDAWLKGRTEWAYENGVVKLP